MNNYVVLKQHTMNDSSSNDGDLKIKINPYNINNKLITNIDVQKILRKFDLNIEINNIRNYHKSLSHKSYCKKKNNDNDIEIADKPDGVLELQDESNERLEFLGDSIINSVVANYLFERFPQEDEGFMTRIRTKLVNGQTLGMFARNIGLTEFLLISRHVEERCNGRESYRILEDAFESFIGAIFLDCNEIDLNGYYNNLYKKQNHSIIKKIENKLNKLSQTDNEIKDCLNDLNKLKNNLKDNIMDLSGPGYQICQIFIISVIENNISFQDLILKDTNFKDQLLRYFQHNYQITPKYFEEHTDGPPHSRIFTMSVSGPNGNIIGTGKGRSKKKAEQIASKFALIYLGELTGDILSDDDN